MTAVDCWDLMSDGTLKLTFGADGKVFCMVTLGACGSEAVSELSFPHAVRVDVRHTAAKKPVNILFFIIFTPYIITLKKFGIPQKEIFRAFDIY